MTTLIDGYNLLHVTGLSGPAIRRAGIEVGALERSRNALLNFIAEALDEDERRQTIVAFDSSNAPPGLPREVRHRGVAVQYAVGYESADELLEQLIREVSVPRQLTVVSSDHRVQRAAKRRKARAVDSDVWYAEMRAARYKTGEPRPPSSAKPACPLSDQEVAAWLVEFGDVGLHDVGSNEQAAPRVIENPFPPGYAEDLLDES